MDKYDIKRERKALYAPSGKDFTLVEVPELHYLAVDGEGDPNTAQAYLDAVQALYAVAYTLKFACKRELERDFVVAPLEGLWRADDMSTFVTRDKSSWSWTMMIALPDWVAPELVAAAKAAAAAKKQLPALDALRFLVLTEGLCTQIMHTGSYDDEAPTLARLHDEWMPEHGLTFNGDHHEIYLGDPRKTVPAKLRTVLRQPVRKVAG
jgi:hypothetical protein